MHIESSGHGPDLILLHGWAMHGGVFAPLLPLLQARFTVHAVDLPGHGRSRSCGLPLAFDAVWDELRARLPQPALVMGWSLGGLFALHGALAHPAACRGLILQNASPCFVHRPDWPDGMPALVFRQFAAELQRDYAQTLHRFFMLEAQGSEHLRDDLRLLQRTAFEFGEPDARVLVEGLHLLETVDLRARLPELTMPSLWLAGRRDRLVSASAMHSACKATGGAFVCDEHGGHAPFLTHPAAVAAAVIGFTEGL
ncbi:MAG: pimeloyl-ACP methyl ester esterase BioH [Arenimonas sp.]